MTSKLRKTAAPGPMPQPSSFPRRAKLTGLTITPRVSAAASTASAIPPAHDMLRSSCWCLIFGLGALLLAGCATSGPTLTFNEPLRQELLQMRDADQRVRRAAFHATNFHGILQ